VVIDRDRLRALHHSEVDRFASDHPVSGELYRRAHDALLAGVPMTWMARWPGPHPVFVAHAAGARFTDVDGHEYVDFCLGDTGAMTGHSPPDTVDELTSQARRGITTMLPTADAGEVGQLLSRRFRLPCWQLAMTATDANRFAIRLARHLTGRPRVLVMNWCYHGTVDEALWILGPDRAPTPRPGSIGPAPREADAVAIVEFNDVAGLERVLSHGDVALVLAEPALTNVGIVLPEPGYHAALRDLTRRHGTLLCIDETHTICVGPGGATAAWSLEPDLLTIGKPIAGGVPAAAYGMTREVAEAVVGPLTSDTTDVSGIGGTLSGNALAVAAMRATLASMLTDDDFARMVPLAGRWTAGVADVIAEQGLEWHVQQLGCRAEYTFCAAPRNGGEAAASTDHELEAFLHLWALNRGVLLTPFHNMALMSPATTPDDVDRHTDVFASAVAALVA
jgi:glutamate-1-semialdehyde 2,1-aminomutase